jgi:citrate synthase
VTDGPSFPTSLGTSTADQIRLLGQDLTADLMGKVSFGELAFWLVTLRRPTPSETRVFEAVLVALADHGFTPTAIAARVTYLSAPDSLQGALAAGLLGGGSRFLGVTEDCGRYLHDVLETMGGELPANDAQWDALALTAVTKTKLDGKFVPGLGHPVHKVTDPRTPVLIEIAEQEGLRGPHLRLFEAIGQLHEGRLEHGVVEPESPRQQHEGGPLAHGGAVDDQPGAVDIEEQAGVTHPHSHGASVSRARVLT